MSKQVTLMTDAIPYQEFAKLIGKSTGAVRRMIDKGKLPVIDMTDPQSASGRAGEYRSCGARRRSPDRIPR